MALSKDDKLQALSVILTRAAYASQLGLTYGGDRDLYKVLGYKTDLTYYDYFNRYKRGDIAKRIINAPIDATWRNPPTISDAEKEEGEETEFERVFNALAKRLDLWEQLRRADRLTGLGKYGVLFLGFNDPNPSQPVSGNSLLYLQPYGENNAEIVTWEENSQNERFGQPLKYNITFSTADKQSTSKRPVHYSRILHFADDPLENNVYGTPRMEAVYNRLQDLEKIVGGSGEMFWRGARPGHAAQAQEGAKFTDEVAEGLEKQFDEFDHGLRRFLQVSGLDIKPLAPQVSSPAEHMKAQLELIAATEGIPLRILIGSERGELASSQDERAWAERVMERKTQLAEPVMLRPFVDKCIERGVLPEPKGGYAITWPEVYQSDDKDQADIAKIRSEALAAYANSSAPQMFPPEQYLEFIMQMDREQILQITENLTGIIEEENEE